MARFVSSSARAAYALSAVALLQAGCSDVAEPKLESAKSALGEERVWITIARDSVESVSALLGTRPSMQQMMDGRDEGPVALLVPRASLPEISEAQHEERDRCAGFMLHDSQADAMETLGALASPYASFRLAPTYSLDRADTVKALLPTLEDDNVLATVRKLSSFRTRFHTSMTGQEASKWIHDAWKLIATGRDDITVELIDHDKTPQPSIAMTIRGATAPEQIVVLGGHMDSIAGRGDTTTVAPGADDNASGIATITEVARAAIAMNYRPAHTVIFYAYAAEEIGLVGSAEIAARAKAEKKSVLGVLQLDMTNYTKSTTPYIALISDFTDPALNDFSAKLIESYLDVPWKRDQCGYACSDHASWTKHGYPAVAPHESTLAESNKQIHTPNDTLALTKDSVAHSMHFARFGMAFMVELAKGSLAATPECSATLPCKGSERCDAGMCVAVPPPIQPAATPPSPSAPGLLPACTDDDSCTGGDACVAGQCVAVTGSRVARDGGLRAPDAGRRASGDAGKPRASSPDLDGERDELEDERDESDAEDDAPPERATKRAAGCALASHRPAGDPWLLLTIAALLWPRRPRSLRRAPHG